MSKDLWIDAWNELYEAALDAGRAEEDAEKLANAGADDLARDRLAETADHYRQLKKDSMI